MQNECERLFMDSKRKATTNSKTCGKITMHIQTDLDVQGELFESLQNPCLSVNEPSEFGSDNPDIEDWQDDTETNGQSCIESFGDSITQVRLSFTEVNKVNAMGYRMTNRILGCRKMNRILPSTSNSDDTLFKKLLSLYGMGMATSQRFVLTNRPLEKKIAPT